MQTVVYQLRSSEDHRSFSSGDRFVFSPQFWAPGCGEADLWVWGLEDLSAPNKQTIIKKMRVLGLNILFLVFVFMMPPTSAPASLTVWLQDPAACRSIQCSQQSLKAQKTEGERKEISLILILCTAPSNW